MTTPRYPTGCVEGSQDRGETVDPENENNAFAVNLNNGNANWNNRNNQGVVRAVCPLVPPPGEYQGAQPVSFHDLYIAWREARRGKKPSRNQLRFDTRWADRLLELQEQLNAGTWSPAKPICFIATAPKAREIHAPDFADRVLHHWLVPPLEAVYERIFIEDSYANRQGKGTHAAVRRLQTFVRQVWSGQGDGWFLQLDISNFFNSILREKLYRLIKAVMEKHNLPLPIRQAVHSLLRHPPLKQGVNVRYTPAERALVPWNKRLENAGPGRGITIGNLSSQFFANVYLNELDQFVKHELRVKRYLRYVDDFVLIHREREQLVAWQARIEEFLNRELGLKLKPEIRLQRLDTGIDFLGYVVNPQHVRVRRRVVSHCRAALTGWARGHVGAGEIRAMPEDLRRLKSVWGSYQGHFAHANAWSLQQQFYQRFPWLAPLTDIKRRFDYRMEDRQVVIAIPRMRKG